MNLKQNKDNKKNVSWVNDGLNWLTKEQSKSANQERDKLLESISTEISYQFKESKPYYRGMSPGCLICGEGYWSCIWINGLCPANCFYCPQDRKMQKERSPITVDRKNGLVFENPDDYVDYLKMFGFKGVGFSGGEPLLVLDKLLSFIEKIKHKFGKEMYVWMYTNGKLVNEDKLNKLKNAGLDEIRFNISAFDYDTQCLELATKFINTVTVEVPAIPEDFELMKKRILDMQNIGVRYLNLHQLFPTGYNYKSYLKRKYTFLRSPAFAILESEITALNLIKYAADSNLNLPINYCSLIFKRRFQSRGHRRRAAPFAIKPFENETDLGYIRRFSVKGSSEEIENIDRLFRESKYQSDLWALNDTKTELFFHHSLLNHIDIVKNNVMVSYFVPVLTVNSGSNSENTCDDNYTKIKLNNDKDVPINRKLVFQKRLLNAIQFEIMLSLKRFERMGEGLGNLA